MATPETAKGTVATARSIWRHKLLGIPIAVTTYDEVLDWIDETVELQERGYICVSAVHTVMESQEDPRLREAVLQSSLTVPDGQPLVWALRLFGHKLPDRVYGPELMLRACAHAAAKGQRFFLYGGRNEEAGAKLRSALEARFPGLEIVGQYVPPFRSLSESEEREVVDQINHSRPDVVWVGLGVPKQEKWMAHFRPRLHAPVLIGVGAAFDFHAGLVPQAPPLLQRAGLEWAFRLIQEPRRLWRRYLKYNPLFVIGIARQYFGSFRRK